MTLQVGGIIGQATGHVDDVTAERRRRRTVEGDSAEMVLTRKIVVRVEPGRATEEQAVVCNGGVSKSQLAGEAFQ